MNQLEQISKQFRLEKERTIEIEENYRKMVD